MVVVRGSAQFIEKQTEGCGAPGASEGPIEAVDVNHTPLRRISRDKMHIVPSCVNTASIHLYMELNIIAKYLVAGGAASRPLLSGPFDP